MRPVSRAVQPVLRLEIRRGRRRDLGPLRLEPEDVADRVLAGMRGRATRVLDPRTELARLVTRDRDRPAHQSLRRLGAAAVHPDDRVGERLAAAIDRDGARPLRRDRHRDHRRGIDRGPLRQLLRTGDDARPPVGGPLLDRAARTEQQRHGPERAVDVLAVNREPRDFRARRAEVDREDVVGQRVRPLAPSCSNRGRTTTDRSNRRRGRRPPRRGSGASGSRRAPG